MSFSLALIRSSQPRILELFAEKLIEEDLAFQGTLIPTAVSFTKKGPSEESLLMIETTSHKKELIEDLLQEHLPLSSIIFFKAEASHARILDCTLLHPALASCTKRKAG